MRIFPKRIRKGDKIGLIAPAGNISKEKLDRSIANVKSLGCEVDYRNDILMKYGYLAGTDERRLEEFHQMMARKDIYAVYCVRGGYGLTRIIGRIDYELVQKNPKPIIGYSDITALLNSVYQKTGIIGFHGPVASAKYTGFAVRGLKEVLFEGKSNIMLFAKDDMDTPASTDVVYTINNGAAEGLLAGGNLSLIASMIGTEYEINFDNKIVLIEEVGEEPYKIDRMITQLIESGSLDMAKGVVCGRFSGCDAEEVARSLTLKGVLLDRFTLLNIPVFSGLQFGHIADNFTLPIGVLAEMNATECTLNLVESAVR